MGVGQSQGGGDRVTGEAKLSAFTAYFCRPPDASRSHFGAGFTRVIISDELCGVDSASTVPGGFFTSVTMCTTMGSYPCVRVS